jgi:hypothetical protein
MVTASLHDRPAASATLASHQASAAPVIAAAVAAYREQATAQTAGATDPWGLCDALVSWRERTAAGALRELVRELAQVLAEIDNNALPNPLVTR